MIGRKVATRSTGNKRMILRLRFKEVLIPRIKTRRRERLWKRRRRFRLRRSKENP